MHSPALNIDKDPYELSVTSEPSVLPPPLEIKIMFNMSKIVPNFEPQQSFDLHNKQIEFA